MRVHSLWAALLAAVSCAAAGVQPGDPAPEITLDVLLPERPVADATLQALAGKAVVLEFWATWCGPCVAAIPHLDELAARFVGRPVVFLSVTDEDRALVEGFLRTRPIQGWVGIAKDLKASYGVEGIPDTFLIDPHGRIAANLFPDVLKFEMIEDLMAGRPVHAPRRPSFDSMVVRSGEAGGPAPLADILIRPSTTGLPAMATGKGKLAIQGGQLPWIVSAVYQAPATRVRVEALDDHTRYDLSINLPGTAAAEFGSLARSLLDAAFHVRTVRETRDTAILVITAPHGKPSGMTESESPGRSWMTGNGKLQMTNGGMVELAQATESVVGKPVLDETGVGGRYDLTLNYRNPDGLLAAIRELGLSVEPARRPIEFLVVLPAR
jgi:uncharacterized protein (TIGR03435 family)